MSGWVIAAALVALVIIAARALYVYTYDSPLGRSKTEEDVAADTAPWMGEDNFAGLLVQREEGSDEAMT